jgi:hypothetical protein
MSDIPTPQKLFQLFCHADSRCTLKVIGQTNSLEFENVVEAMCAVLKMAGGDKPNLTVFGPWGAVLFETQL